jgi:putative membrane protein
MPAQLKEFLQRWIIIMVAVLVATHIVRGIHYDNWQGLLIATLVLGLLNAFLKPVLLFLSLPLVIVTFGLFTIVINALLLYMVGRLKDFHVDSFKAAFWGALIISIVSLVLNSLTGSGSSRIEFRRGKPGPRSNKTDDGGGPVIDV